MGDGYAATDTLRCRRKKYCPSHREWEWLLEFQDRWLRARDFEAKRAKVKLDALRQECNKRHLSGEIRPQDLVTRRDTHRWEDMAGPGCLFDTAETMLNSGD